MLLQFIRVLSMIVGLMLAACVAVVCLHVLLIVLFTTYHLLHH
jgi:hypothetical protein